MITTWPVSVICALVLPDNNRFEQSAGSLAQRVFIGYRRGTWCGLPSQEESGLARALLGGSCCFASVGLGPDTLVTHRPRASALLVNTDPLNPPPHAAVTNQPCWLWKLMLNQFVNRWSYCHLRAHPETSASPSACLPLTRKG